jgi:hypothetical protein
VVIGGSSLSSSASSCPSAPKTVRRMIRSVIVWKDSIEANSTPSGQAAIARSASSSMIAS